MTTKDHIIFFIIFSVLIIGIPVLLYIEGHIGGDGGDQPLVEHVAASQDGGTHKESNSMIDNITAIIIAFGALITILYGVPNYREKMRKNRIDKLKDRMLVLFSEGWNSQRVHTPETLKEFFEALGPKFQKKRYKDLHQTAFDELGREGRNPIWSDWNLKHQMIERQRIREMEAVMPGPDGVIYRGGGRIIREEDEGSET